MARGFASEKITTPAVDRLHRHSRSIARPVPASFHTEKGHPANAHRQRDDKRRKLSAQTPAHENLEAASKSSPVSTLIKAVPKAATGSLIRLFQLLMQNESSQNLNCNKAAMAIVSTKQFNMTERWRVGKKFGTQNILPGPLRQIMDPPASLSDSKNLFIFGNISSVNGQA